MRNTTSLIIVLIYLISSDWEEIWDKESVNKYMDIMETATVLEKIHDKFAGMSGCVNVLVAL